MGAVDLVIQVESPPSVASGLQRVGRAGHQVGAVSQRRHLPQVPRRPRPDGGRRRAHARRRHRGAARPAQPARRARPADRRDGRDGRRGTVDELLDAGTPGRAVRRAARSGARRRRSTCWPAATRATSSPSCGHASSGTASPARSPAGPGAQRLAVTSGGTIPDRGLFGVFLVGENGQSRVGELDEEMVYESRVGDVFTSARRQLADRGHHPRPGAGLPAPGPARAAAVLEGRRARPPGRARRARRRVRPRARAALDRDAAAAPRPRGRARRWAADNLLAYLRRAARGHRHLPDDRTIVVERFRDELGDWRVVVHSPFGARCTRPWALAIAARLRERYGVDAQAMHTDDGIVLRLPDDRRRRRRGAELVAVRPRRGRAARHRRGRRVGAVRVPVPRVRGARAAAARGATPAAARRCGSSASAPRSCSQVGQRVRLVPDRARDDARVPAGRVRRAGLIALMRDSRPRAGPRRRGRDASRRRRSPGRCCSATSRSSCTRATRRSPSAAPRRSPSTRRCSPSCSGGPSCASCSTPTALAESRPSCSGSRRAARPRRRGRRRPAAPARCRSRTDEVARAARRRGRRWLAELEDAAPARDPRAHRRRGALGRRRGRRPAARRARHAAARRRARGVHRAGRRPARRSRRPLRAHPRAVHRDRRRRPVRPRHRRRRPTRCTGSPRRAAWSRASSARAAPAPSGATPRCCARCAAGRSPRCARRSSRCRPRPRAVPAALAARRRRRLAAASTACSRADRAAAGRAAPRVERSSSSCCRPGCRLLPALLDELTTAGEVLWAGHGALPGDDGWISLHLADTAPLLLPPVDAERATRCTRVLDALERRRRVFFRTCPTGSARPTTARWSPRCGIWSGRARSPTTRSLPLRTLLGGGRGAHSGRCPAPRSRMDGR